MLYMKCEKSSIQRFDTCPARCTKKKVAQVSDLFLCLFPNPHFLLISIQSLINSGPHDCIKF